jgi:transcription antitermination factor NusG
MEWTDRSKVIIRPLFVGYTFVRFGCDPETFDASDVVRIPGVVQILPTSLNPFPISDAEIESLKIVLASNLPLSRCPYVAGETVFITHGALAGVSGVVIRTKGHTRVVVSVPMLMASVNVEIAAADLEKQT